MREYEYAVEHLNIDDLEALKPYCAVNEIYTQRMVEYAQPRAIAVLDWRAVPETVSDSLPVITNIVPKYDGIFGQLMPAWPVAKQRPVTIYALDNWYVYLYLLRNTIGEPASSTSLVDQLFRDHSRIQVGITNDVIQPFVNNPPDSSYSFVRHHALMLFLGMLWLPERQQRGWFKIMDWCSRTLYRECKLDEMQDPLGWIDAIALTGDHILKKYGPSTRSNEGVFALLANKDVLVEFFPYLGATSLAIASINYQYRFCPEGERQTWQTQAANVWHSDPAFNTDWILDYLETMK